MAKQTLPVDFQDDLLNVSMGEKRRYRMINNSDGTVSLEDVTVYDRIGSNFGAGQINATNQAVNESFDKNKLIRDLDTINALTEEGYAVDALSVKQITESLEWKLVGSATGQTEISLPNSFNELYAEVVNNNNNWVYTYNLQYVALTSSKKQYFEGFWLNDTSNGMTQVCCSKTKINLSASYRKNVNETNNSTITVYYR